jgi:phytoene synthase
MTTRATTFYYSFLALPAVKRDAVIAVWDFCRAVDDAVDEPAAGDPAGELSRWRAEVSRLYAGTQPITPQGVALQPVIQRFHLPRAAFDDLIDGVAMDLDHRRYQTFDQLRQYCVRVASAVGLMCVEIFGYRDVRSRDYAIELGIALQLTNIIRDVESDMKRGRLYLPLDDLQRFGCREQDLESGVMTDAVRNLLQFECARAREYYGKAERTLPKSDARRLVAAQIMGAIYLELLGSIERGGYDVFGGRIRISRPRQALIALTTWLKHVA